MSSQDDSPDIQHATEKRTVGDFIDSHKESAILIIGLIVLLVGVLKLGQMMLNVCNDFTNTSAMRNILCLCSKSEKLTAKMKESVTYEDEHTHTTLHYDAHFTRDTAVYAQQHDKNGRLDGVKSVSVKSSEAGKHNLRDHDEALPMLVVDHRAGNVV